MSNKRHLRSAVSSFLSLVAMVLFSACGSGSNGPANSICCDNGSTCICYPNQTCPSDQTQVSQCPQYGHNCLHTDGSDFCTSSARTCYDTYSYSVDVSSCP